MPITSLRAQLQAQATDAPILISEHGAWRLSELTAALQTAALHEARKNPAVALRLDDPAKLALALIALDGEIDRMLLLPGGLADQDADALVAQFGATALLTDRAQTSASAWGHIDWSGAIETGTESSPVVQNRKTQWVLSTSGTTGTPKLVAHSLASLTRTTKAQSKSPLHWGQLYDIARFAGAQVFLQGILGGVLVLPRGDWSLPQRISFLAQNGCAALSATPTLWRKILMTPGPENLALSQVTLGGEIADAAILRAVANKFPAARVTHIFASTEAGAAFSVRDGLPGFPTRYLSEPPGGVALK
ncbi:MAG: AMP-binding protein, partial [Caulobacterales bacterium]